MKNLTSFWTVMFITLMLILILIWLMFEVLFLIGVFVNWKELNEDWNSVGGDIIFDMSLVLIITKLIIFKINPWVTKNILK